MIVTGVKCPPSLPVPFKSVNGFRSYGILTPKSLHVRRHRFRVLEYPVDWWVGGRSKDVRGPHL